MRRMIRQILAVFILSSCWCFSASAGDSPPLRYQEDGWLFFIRRAQVMDLTPGAAYTVIDNGPGAAASPANKSVRILEVDFAAFQDGKPFVLGKSANVHFCLTDTAGHPYPLLSMADFDDGLGPPSMAAGEDRLSDPDRKLYFQFPTDIPVDLILEVDASALGVGRTFQIFLPGENIRFVHSIYEPRFPVDGDFQVQAPAPGTDVHAGDRVQVSIDLDPQVRKPARILLMTPTETFEDDTSRGEYAVNIPDGTQSGPYHLLVLGVWNKGREPLTISRLIPLKVTPKNPCCDHQHDSDASSGR